MNTKENMIDSLKVYASMDDATMIDNTLAHSTVDLSFRDLSKLAIWAYDNWKNNSFFAILSFLNDKKFRMDRSNLNEEEKCLYDLAFDSDGHQFKQKLNDTNRESFDDSFLCELLMQIKVTESTISVINTWDSSDIDGKLELSDLLANKFNMLMHFYRGLDISDFQLD